MIASCKPEACAGCTNIMCAGRKLAEQKEAQAEQAAQDTGSATSTAPAEKKQAKIVIPDKLARRPAAVTEEQKSEKEAPKQQAPEDRTPEDENSVDEVPVKENPNYQTPVNMIPANIENDEESETEEMTEESEIEKAETEEMTEESEIEKAVSEEPAIKAFEIEDAVSEEPVPEEDVKLESMETMPETDSSDGADTSKLGREEASSEEPAENYKELEKNKKTKEKTRKGEVDDNGYFTVSCWSSACK